MKAMGFLDGQGVKARGIGWQEEAAPTLRGGVTPSVLIVLEDQGGGVIHWNHDDVSPTLRAEMHGHLPVVAMKDDSVSEKIQQRDCEENRNLPDA